MRFSMTRPCALSARRRQAWGWRPGRVRGGHRRRSAGGIPSVGAYRGYPRRARIQPCGGAGHEARARAAEGRHRSVQPVRSWRQGRAHRRGERGSGGVSRIDRRFAALKAADRTGLIPFITAGDPSPEHMVALMHALVAAGADLIELGVPFSDPMADGPVIQHASERAIARGVGLDDVLGWVGTFRQRDVDTPIVLMGYLNPVEIHGYVRFAREAAEAGVDGVLLVDCPLEESTVLQSLREAGLQQILLAAPTTAPARMAQLCSSAEGFLYYVSFAGAVVIGSALVESLAAAADAADIPDRARSFLQPIRAALDAR